MNDWKPVGRALLGSWPSQVTAWGKDGIAAYISELEARGVTPDAALAAIRSCPVGQRFPLSAPELAGLARCDPSMPVAAEAVTMIYGRGGVMKAHPPYQPGGWAGHEFASARDDAQLRRAAELHPLLGAFVRAEGLQRLRMLEVDSADYGELERKRLGERWIEFCKAREGREIAAIVAPRRGGGLAQFELKVGALRGDQ